MNKSLFALLLAAAGLANAQQGNDPQSLVEMTVRSGHAIEGFMYGTPVIAVPIPNQRNQRNQRNCCGSRWNPVTNRMAGRDGILVV